MSFYIEIARKIKYKWAFITLYYFISFPRF